MVGIALAVPLRRRRVLPDDRQSGQHDRRRRPTRWPMPRSSSGWWSCWPQKLEKEPNNPKGWAMLARSYKVMGRTAEAEKAFERAGSFIDDDAQMLASYADVVASNAGGQLGRQADDADPEGAEGRPRQSRWRCGCRAPPIWKPRTTARPCRPGSGWRRCCRPAPTMRACCKAPSTMSAPRAACAAKAAAPAPAAAAAAGGNVSGTVELDPALKGKAGPDDTVMIIARLPGTRMPLAAVRLRAVGAAGEVHARRFAIDESAVAHFRRRRGGGRSAHFEVGHGEGRVRAT